MLKSPIFISLLIPSKYVSTVPFKYVKNSDVCFHINLKILQLNYNKPHILNFRTDPVD